MLDLKDFQEDAVSKLVETMRKQVSAIDSGAMINPNIIFKSPTGSGKTIMMTEALRRLPDEFDFNDKYFVYLWLAPVKLHAQSYKKLKKELHDDIYNLINIDDGLTSDPLAPNTLLFSNWEKLNSTAKKDDPEKGLKAGDWTNTAVRQGEQANLQDILNATREKGGKIILIVDECHQAFFGDKSQRFVDEVVKPSLIVQLSATPKEKPTIEVKYEDVVESGLIKNQIIINNDLANSSTDDKTVIESLILQSLKQRDDLAKKYEAMGKNINPLLLIQLPNETDNLSDLDIKYRDIIEEVLLNEGINYDYGNMAVWLSEEKRNLENIEAPDNPVKVLLFKQAIALGWDCPRAQALLMLRDIKSDSFKIQTIGRILRMPEAEHYLDDTLNTAYVFTDLESIKVDADAKDPMRNLIKYKVSRINPVFNSDLITLPDSIFLTRVDYGDLKADFHDILENVLEQAFGLDESDDEKTCYEKIDEKLEVYDEELTTVLLSDEVLENIDEAAKQDFFAEGDIVKRKLDDAMVENVFNAELREDIKPFKNFARSRSIVYGSLKNVFRRGGFSDFDIQRIFACSKLNKDFLRECFEIAIDQYSHINQQDLKKRRDREGKVFDFTIPERDEFSDNSESITTIRNVYVDYYRSKNAPTTTEVPFEEYLDHSHGVSWWYKNGDKGEKYFAVEYWELDEKALSHRAAFYPDYIVKFKDGTTGVFDTKSGFTSENKNAKQKANALQDYLRKHADLCLWGGIVRPAKNNTGWEIQADYLNNQIARSDHANLPDFDYSDENWVSFEIPA
ncbi:MAG: DEAD/DEAH box helicase family protein [Candidatus Saccharibacteria bacterium]|nr:DEAD/DEAH box helicase family protein [Candidatus Saccharibacteria bacterium]